MQTHKGSIVETLASTAVGFAVSVLVWEFVVKPIWQLETNFVENLSITALFTVVSLARGYAVRRFFNHLHNKNNSKVANDQSDSVYGPSALGERHSR